MIREFPFVLSIVEALLGFFSGIFFKTKKQLVPEKVAPFDLVLCQFGDLFKAASAPEPAPIP
jgi:hypothetical protein